MPMDHPLGESMLRTEVDDDDMPPLVQAPGSTAIVPYSFSSNYATRTGLDIMSLGKPIPTDDDDEGPPDLAPPPLFDPEDSLGPSLSMYSVTGVESLPPSPSFLHPGESTLTFVDSGPMQMSSLQDTLDLTSQGSSAEITGPTRSSRKHPARSASYIPRPPNAFILFRSSFVRAQRIPGRVEGNHSTLSKIAGMYWKNMRKEEREQWEQRAIEKLEEHRKRYPDWRFRPGNTSGLKLKDGGGGGSGAGPGSGTATGSSKGGSQSSSNTGVQVKRRKRALTTAASSSAHPDAVAQDTLRQKRCEKIVDLLEEGVVGPELAARVDEYDRDVALSGGFSLNLSAPLMTTLNIEVQTSQIRDDQRLANTHDLAGLSSLQSQIVKREEQGQILIFETSPTPTSPYAPPSPFTQTSALTSADPSSSRVVDVQSVSATRDAMTEETRYDASASQKRTGSTDLSDSGNKFRLPLIPLTAIAKRSSSAPAAPGRVPVLGLASLEFNFPEAAQVNILPMVRREYNASVEQTNEFLPSATLNNSGCYERCDPIHASILVLAQTAGSANENVGSEIGVVPSQSPVVQTPLLSSYSSLEGWAGPPQSTTFHQFHNVQSPQLSNAQDTRPPSAVPLSGSFIANQYNAGPHGLNYNYSTNDNMSYGHGYYTVNSTGDLRQSAPGYAFEDYPATGTNLAGDRRGSISSNSSSGSIYDQGA